MVWRYIYMVLWPLGLNYTWPNQSKRLNNWRTQLETQSKCARPFYWLSQFELPSDWLKKTSRFFSEKMGAAGSRKKVKQAQQADRVNGKFTGWSARYSPVLSGRVNNGMIG
jgi:hypothetical protein